MDRLRINSGAVVDKTGSGPQAAQCRPGWLGGAAAAPVSTAEAEDDRSAAPRRTSCGCRPQFDSRPRSQACVHPPAGSASQEAGQGHDGTPGAGKSAKESSVALSLTHPGSRHSPRLATQGAPSDKTANATAKGRKSDRILRIDRFRHPSREARLNPGRA